MPGGLSVVVVCRRVRGLLEFRGFGVAGELVALRWYLVS
jgi:hypothetical protein